MKVHPAGRLIVMGLPGPELTDGLRDLIRRVQPGGFIFFTRNMAEAGQFHGLVKECAELVAHPTIMTVDQEGGRVARLAVMGERPASGEELARAGKEEWFYEHGRWTGQSDEAGGVESEFGARPRLCTCRNERGSIIHWRDVALGKTLKR